jgi:hypothetical protein
MRGIVNLGDSFMRYVGLAVLCIAVSAASFAQVPGVEHVVVIGVDGLAPRGIQEADTPHMDALMARGAHTLHARAVLPTSSSSNWASMIMGAGPEQHGITSNDWEVDKHEIPPIVAGPTGRFPTVFAVIRTAMPDAVTACFYDWDGFGRLVEPDTPTILEDCAGPVKTIEAAAAYFTEHAPLFTFIHLDHVDHAGHANGWYTRVYNKAVAKADALIGDMISAIDEAGKRDSTLIIVTSDHGGKDKGHGGDSLGEIEIPWIAAGPGVRSGVKLTAPIDTYDTAATVLHALGVTPHEAWIARPVVAAFE